MRVSTIKSTIQTVARKTLKDQMSFLYGKNKQLTVRDKPE